VLGLEVEPSVGRAEDPAERQRRADEIRFGSRPRRRRLLLFAGTLALFALAGGWGGLDLAVLVAVLAVHEAGHAVGMLAFGYRDVSIFFVPLLGAATSGHKPSVPAWQEAVVSLLGPLPGLFVGLAAWALAPLWPAAPEWAHRAVFLLLAVNFLNLLPFAPFDGGRFFGHVRQVLSLLGSAPAGAGAAALLLLLYAAPFVLAPAVYLASLRGGPDHTLRARAHEAYEQGDYPLAAELLRLAAAEGPGDGVHTELGWALNAIGEYEEASRAFSVEIDARVRHSNAHFGRAVALDRLGRHVEAEKDLLAQIELAPEDVRALEALGLRRLSQRRGEDAADYLQRAAAALLEMAAVNDYAAWALPRNFRTLIARDEWRRIAPGAPSRPAGDRVTGLRSARLSGRVLEPLAEAVIVLAAADGRVEDVRGLAEKNVRALERQLARRGSARFDFPRPPGREVKTVHRGLLVCSAATGCSIVLDLPLE
jgi:tetratricopeptide (TPR) repeat protein